MLSSRSMVLWDITFPCFYAGFARVSLTFSSSLPVITRYFETLKCSAQYWWDPESGASVKICVSSECIAVVKFSFMKFCKRSSSDAFYSVSEITLTDSERASWSVLTTQASDNDVFSTSTALSNLFLQLKPDCVEQHHVNGQGRYP